jgi:pimeloyl-[acyl-carrier protein] methyl ester esterase
MPGLDGTGDLFLPFLQALPPEIDAVPVRYPADVPRSYGELAEIARRAFPGPAPFVLVAESFSTPLAIQCAAARPLGLRGLVLCAGFATSPLSGPRRRLAWALARIAFRLPAPRFAVKQWLVGADAPPELVHDVQHSVSKVRPQVLSSRVQSVLDCDVRLDLERIEVPVLYLRATGDRLIPKRCLKEILEIQTEARVVTIPGPHLLFQREPRQTADVVAGFVRDLDHQPKLYK